MEGITKIGIAGATGSGKTTAANYLMDQGYTVLGFATPLYELGGIHQQPRDQWYFFLMEWTVDNLRPMGYQVEDRIWFADKAHEVMEKVPVQNGKNRTLLQLLGTEVGRKLDENLWTNIFERKVIDLGPEAKIINDNLRFPNEMDSLERLNFVTVYIDVDPEVRASRYEIEYGVKPTPEQLSHASEAHLDEIKERSTFIVDNNGHPDEMLKFFSALTRGLVRIAVYK